LSFRSWLESAGDFFADNAVVVAVVDKERAILGVQITVAAVLVVTASRVDRRVCMLVMMVPVASAANKAVGINSRGGP